MVLISGGWSLSAVFLVCDKRFARDVGHRCLCQKARPATALGRRRWRPAPELLARSRLRWRAILARSTSAALDLCRRRPGTRRRRRTILPRPTGPALGPCRQRPSTRRRRSGLRIIPPRPTATPLDHRQRVILPRPTAGALGLYRRRPGPGRRSRSRRGLSECEHGLGLVVGAARVPPRRGADEEALGDVLGEVVAEEPVVRGGDAGVPAADEARDGGLGRAAVLAQRQDRLFDHLQPDEDANVKPAAAAPIQTPLPLISLVSAS